MHEILRYTSTEFEDIWKKIINLEDKLIYWREKTHKKIEIETRFIYHIEEDVWEGELEVTGAEETK